MKKLYTFIIAIVIAGGAKQSHAQTNVSGGIYSNTTWTKVNSPYIVTDTVVVFPGVTLTIQAGVTVKFDNNIILEIRQAKLLAIGTAVDSITFTSNSASPTPGIYVGVYLNGGTLVPQFNYCNFKYAAYAINTNNINFNYTLTVKNSKIISNNVGFECPYLYINIDSCYFRDNNQGLFGDGNISNSSFINNQTGAAMPGNPSTVINCIVDSNQTGLSSPSGPVINCIITNNQLGLRCVHYTKTDNCVIKHNQVGVRVWGLSDTIRNSTIDSNSVAGIELLGGYNCVYNCQIRYNGIGIIDSTTNLPNTGTISKNFIENNFIGIRLGVVGDNIYCNKICNNTSYDLMLTNPNNTTVANNYWCTLDSASTVTVIYDGYDNVNYGLVSFMPLDTSNCYLTGCNLAINAAIINATCATCPNGSATASVNNGVSPYTYTWYTSPIQVTQTATGLAPGTYTICVIDANGCTACDSVFVDSTYCNGSISLSTTATNASCGTCNDGSATANVVGGMWPYTYVWSPTPGSTQSIINLLPGTYSVCVTDGLGCTACSFATVGTGTCSASFNLYPDTILHTYIAVNTAAGAAPLTYSWNWGDGSPASTGPTPSHTYTVAGTYNICLSIVDATGCTNTFCQSYYLLKTTNTMIYVNVISAPTGVNENFDNTSFSVFPNPTTGEFTVYGLRSAVQIKVYNMVGEKVYEMTPALKGATNTISVSLPSRLEQGIYFLQLKTNEGTAVKKIIKE